MAKIIEMIKSLFSSNKSKLPTQRVTINGKTTELKAKPFRVLTHKIRSIRG